jgi:hypothetical protein
MYILQLDGLMTTEADQMWSTVATDLTVGTWVLDTGVIFDDCDTRPGND